jgi:hypothetical protein
MAVPTPSKRLAFDANILIDIALGVDAILTLHEVLSERKTAIEISPTVVQEMSHLLDDPNRDLSKAALTALQSLRTWGVKPFDLVAVGHGITEQFSRELIERKLLPREEFHDGCILAEVSLAKIPLLITSDNHLLSIEQTDLNAAFCSKDLDIVTVMSPRQILQSLEPKNKTFRKR